MPFKTKSFIGVVGSLFLILSGCTDTLRTSPSSTQSTDKADGEENRTALTALNQLQKSPDFSVKDYSRRYTVNGDLHHIRTQLGESNELSRPAGILADGKIVSLRKAERRLHEKHESKWGAIDRGTAAWLQMEPKRLKKRHRFSAWFASSSISLQDAKTLLPPSAKIEKGFHEPPMIQFVSSGKTAVNVAKMSEFNAVGAVIGEAIDASHSSHPGVKNDTSDYVFSRSTFNHRGNFAEDIDIAIVESVAESKSGISDFHEALTGNNVEHLRSPRSCSSVSDCYGKADCHKSHCIWGHSSKVASRISSTEIFDGTPYFDHAAKATIWIPNIGINDITNPAGQIETYNALYDTDGWPMFINESYSNNSDYAFTGNNYVRSWFSRYNKMTFIKVSGNFAYDKDPENEKNEVDCQGLNSVCVGGANSQSSYDNLSDDSFSKFSNSLFPQWENPSFASSHPSQSGDKQVERPDIVSEAIDTQVMNPTSQSSHFIESGTSLAAPTVTGLLALTAKQCDAPYFTPAMSRAMLRTAAWQKHSVEDTSSDPRYPIPGQSPDSFAGAGIPTSNGMELYFGSGGSEDDPNSEAKRGTIDPTTDRGWTSVSQYPFMSEDTFPKTPDSNIVTHQLRSANSVVKPLWEVGSASRIRVTFSYYTCPPGREEPRDFSTVDKNEPAVDFDLILCSKSQKECAAVSESVDDTNEGFDVQVPTNMQQAGDLTVFLVKPSSINVTPCGPADNFLEPWASAIAWWN